VVLRITSADETPVAGRLAQQARSRQSKGEVTMWMRWVAALAMGSCALLLATSCGGSDSGSSGDAGSTREVIEKVQAAYRNSDAAAYAALFAADGRFDDFSGFGDRVRGRSEVANMFRLWFTHVVPPEHTYESRILISDEHLAVVEWSDEWLEEGETVRLEGIGVYEVENGEITHDSEYYDSTPVKPPGD
jgi:limonene-1,2-epoxide hydrolase